MKVAPALATKLKNPVFSFLYLYSNLTESVPCNSGQSSTKIQKLVKWISKFKRHLLDPLSSSNLIPEFKIDFSEKKNVSDIILWNNVGYRQLGGPQLGLLGGMHCKRVALMSRWQ